MMNDRELQTYLGLSGYEYSHLLDEAMPEQVEYWRDLDLISPNLEQLPAKYNRAPEATEASDAAMDAASIHAFARLHQLMEDHNDFLQSRRKGKSYVEFVDETLDTLAST